MLADARTGKNGRHALIGIGYEDVNDAERLRHDPAIRWIVGDKAARGCTASPSQTGRLETAVACNGEQPFCADRLVRPVDRYPGQWIDIVHGRRPPKGIVLDMDSSVSTARRTGGAKVIHREEKESD
jgi:hypothetical protein